MTGKWSASGVPNKGWRCVGVDDLEIPSQICEMCEIREIRYVHHMEHPYYHESLGVGCVCAEKMEGDKEGPRRRESNLINEAQRKKRWLNRKWKISKKGNDYLNTDGFNIIIFNNNSGSWSARIEDQATSQSEFSRQQYKTKDAAKLAAFDAMIFLKKEWGWGS
jgi:hypothetical protein